MRKVALVAALAIAALTPSRSMAGDLNQVYIRGNVQQARWVESLDGLGHVVRSDAEVWIWDYAAGVPQIDVVHCFGLSMTSCISPGIIDCDEAPLDVVQLDPPNAYPLRATRRCQGGEFDRDLGACLYAVVTYRPGLGTLEVGTVPGFGGLYIHPRTYCTTK